MIKLPIKKNKYNARKVYYNGMTFDSNKEFERYLVLADMEKRGIIRYLRHHVIYPLFSESEYFKAVKYEADFVYEMQGQEWVEDVKGMRKGVAYSLFQLNKRIMFEKYKIIVQEI